MITGDWGIRTKEHFHKYPKILVMLSRAFHRVKKASEATTGRNCSAAAWEARGHWGFKSRHFQTLKNPNHLTCILFEEWMNRRYFGGESRPRNKLRLRRRGHDSPGSSRGQSQGAAIQQTHMWPVEWELEPDVLSEDETQDKEVGPRDNLLTLNNYKLCRELSCKHAG